MDYWEECVSEALEDAGISASKEQIDTITAWVEGAHDNYGMATGRDAIPNPMEDEVRRLSRAHAEEIDDLKSQIDKYRSSVARRRGVRVEDVYLDGDTVVYGRA